MRLFSRDAGIAVILLIALGAIVSARPKPAHQVAEDLAPPTDVNGSSTAEVRRIRAHFDSVLAELATRDVTVLRTAQRDRRAGVLATLKAYRDGGVFPHNYDFPGQSVPYFIDRKTGTLCAVAHLLASTGRRDIVDRVAGMDNNVWVPELAGDTAFTDWLDARGLTVAEAARIQVPYMTGDAPLAPPASMGASYVVGSFAALGVSAGTSVWNAWGNARGDSRLGNALGAMSGVAALGFGVTGSREAPAFGATTAAMGGVSVWLATRNILRHRQHVAAQRKVEERRVVVSPIVPMTRQGIAGVSASIRF